MSLGEGEGLGVGGKCGESGRGGMIPLTKRDCLRCERVGCTLQ